MYRTRQLALAASDRWKGWHHNCCLFSENEYSFNFSNIECQYCTQCISSLLSKPLRLYANSECNKGDNIWVQACDTASLMIPYATGATIPSIHSFIFFSICPYTHLSIYLPTHASTHLSSHSFIYPSFSLLYSFIHRVIIYPAIYLSIHLSISSTYPSIHLLTYLSIHPSILSSVQTYPLLHYSIHTSHPFTFYPSIHTSDHLSIHASRRASSPYSLLVRRSIRIQDLTFVRQTLCH